MPTAIGSPKRRKHRTPLDKTAAPPTEPQQPAAPPVPDLEELPRDLQLSRELAFCTCMGLRMETWLSHHLADNGIAPDDCMPAIVLLPIYVEGWLKACVLFPELLAHDLPDEEPEDYGVTESDARHAGLTVVRKRPGKHQPTPTMPGCRGIVNGLECGELRRPGQSLCPSCMKAERERRRGAQC